MTRYTLFLLASSLILLYSCISVEQNQQKEYNTKDLYKEALVLLVQDVEFLKVRDSYSVKKDTVFVCPAHTIIGAEVIELEAPNGLVIFSAPKKDFFFFNRDSEVMVKELCWKKGNRFILKYSMSERNMHAPKTTVYSAKAVYILENDEVSLIRNRIKAE